MTKLHEDYSFRFDSSPAYREFISAVLKLVDNPPKSFTYHHMALVLSEVAGMLFGIESEAVDDADSLRLVLRADLPGMMRFFMDGYKQGSHLGRVDRIKREDEARAARLAKLKGKK